MSNHTLSDVQEGKDYSFPLQVLYLLPYLLLCGLNESQEEAILKFWEETDAFHQQLKLSEGRPEYETPYCSGFLLFSY